ncbi:MAG TPA: glycoside hydrolase [Prolixibacteraceae bacterium]|nr:glycoside hydrolase [Prolixibacteraceae bacterium]
MNRLALYTVCIIGLLINSLTAFSQNLIKNPGFESDKTYWNNFWSKEGTGSATIVTDPVHSGAKAIKIDYPGSQDWAFTSASRQAVIPGTWYEMSCWAMITDLSSEANLSVVLYDANQNVINWVYSRINLGSKSSVYRQFSSTFVIPEGVKYIVPRFEGWGKCVVYADDVSLLPYDPKVITGNFTIENSQVKAVAQLPSLSINMVNKSSSKSYQTGLAQFVNVSSAEQINAESLRLTAKMQNTAQSELTIDLMLEGKALKMTISGDSALSLNNDFQFPGMISSQANDYFIVPRGTGIIFPVNSSNPFGNFQTYSWKATMPFVGVTNLKDGYMVATDDQYDAEFQFQKPIGQNLYSFQLLHKPAKKSLSYNRVVYLVLVDNGYVEMCNWYRSHAEKLGFVKTMEQKRADNPNIDKLIGAVDFWPLSMNINPTFVETVKLMGIDKAMWNLTGGWGTYNFSVLIDSLNSKGFLSNRYDIFTDVWPSTHPEWSSYRTEGYPDDVIVDSNGELQKGWLAYKDNLPWQGYYTCSETHLAYAKNHVPLDLKTNRYNARFIDVELSSSLTECFSPLHPVTRKQDAAARNQLLGYIKNDLTLVTGAEEAHDFAFPNVDYGEGTMTIIPATNAGYDWSQPLEPTDKTYADQNISTKYRIPLHGLVYHDVHIPTWYTGDGASKVPAYWEDKNLWNILYATMPLYMPPSRTYWDTNLEKFISGYHLISTVTRNVGYSKMINHEFLSDDHQLQQTTYENGWKVVANFDTIPREWDNRMIAAKGFYASGGKMDEAGKLMINNQPVAWAFTGNRLFLNPFGIEATVKGLRSSQSVFMQKFPDYLLFSFIGKQNFVDINPADLPFDIEEITSATEYYSGSAINLTNTIDGWKRLTRPAGKSYFKLYYRTKVTGLLNTPAHSALKIYPNPAQDQLIIQQASGKGFLSICNMKGMELIQQPLSTSNTTVDIGLLASGIYIVNLVQDGSKEVRKFVKR